MILIYYAFVTIIYDLPDTFLTVYQFSFPVKCSWFGQKEIFDSLTDLLFRIEGSSIQKVL